MKILFAFDGSDHARAAAALLGRLPLPAGSAITVLCVAETPSQFWRTLEGEPARAVERAEQEREDRALDDARAVAGGLRREGVDVHIAAGTGDPAEIVLEKARADGSDLLVLGARGVSTLDRILLGSVAGHALAEAPCSLLLARPPEEAEAANRPLRILVGYDGSDAARRALDGLKSCPIAGRAEVRVLTVLELLSGYGADVLQKLSPIWAEEKARARAALEEVADELRASGIDAQSDLREAEEIAEQVAMVADEMQAELVVVGRTGRHGLARLLPGRTAERLARIAPCSVWIAR